MSTQRATFIDRPRVARILDGILDHRLTTIVTGPGAGKTIALRQWAGDHTAAWHSVSRADASLTDFARSLVDAIRLRIPGLPTELAMAVDAAQGPDGAGDDESRAEALAALLAEGLSGLSRPVVLAIDDLHRLPPAPLHFVGTLATTAPPQLHIACATREPVPFPVSRLALNGDLFAVAPDELNFTIEETEALVEATLAGPSPDLARELHERTGGWAAVTRLAIEALKSNGSTGLDELLQQHEGTALFSYLAESVTAAEREDIRELIAAAAALPWITPELADHLGVGKGAETLALAGRRGMYFLPFDRFPGAVRLAPIMRSHAGLPASPDLLPKAAEWYEAAGALAEALACLTASEDEAATIALLLRHASSLATTMPERVISAIEGLSPESIDDELTQLEGEARQMIGDWEGAEACFSRLARGNRRLRPAVAWRYGLLHHLRGEIDEALAVYRRGRVDDDAPADSAMLLAWTASARWLKGEREAMRTLSAQAHELARKSGDARALASSHTVAAMLAALDGDRHANDVHYLRALEHAEHAHDLLQTVRIRVNRGSQSLEEGAYAQALEELDIALRLADLAGFAALRGLALSNRAEVHFHQGRLEEALADLEEARRVFRSNGSHMECYALLHIGEVYAARGDHALAREAFEQAIAMSERTGDLQGLVPSLAGLGRLIAEEDLDRAADLADRALAHGEVLGYGLALVASAEVALVAGDTDRAAHLASEAAELARARRDRPGQAEALQTLARALPDQAGELLRQARSIWEQVGDPVRLAATDLQLAEASSGDDAAELARSAIGRLQRLGAHGLITPAARRMAQPRKEGPVAIKTLGGFAVVRQDGQVGATEWQSKKARELLKILVAMRGRPQHREVIMDLLWPGEDPAKASNRLSVALSTVRSVLDPGKVHDADYFVGGDRTSVALNTDTLDIDTERFLDLAGRGLAAWERGDRAAGRSLLEAAEVLYVGDFLEEDLYADWSVTIREELRTTYLRLAEVLAEASTAEGDHDAASRLYLRILERDEYHEPAHLGLVRTMTALGRHGAARRLYGNYVRRMRELAVDPAPFPG